MTPAEQVKERVDIVEFIRQYVALKPAGTNFRGLCPFHKEKTPSFMVSPSRRSFKCFGCGKGGDVFTFLELYEGMAFAESLRLLAEKVGVRIADFNTHLYTRKNRLYDLLRAASEFYHAQLLNTESVRAYLSRRGIDELTRDSFFLGYSPDDWHAASRYLKQQKFSDEEMKSAGLVIPGTRGCYDRFRGRLMFPISDEHGRVIGFGGRILNDEAGGAKYINSPEGEVYSKSSVLYGLHKAKDAIRKTGYAILVEGYMDVLASHKAGTVNAVAVSGTALTEAQLTLLKRFTNTLLLAFDMDDAGVAAALRSYLIAVNFGMNTKIVQLSHGKDPDELIRTDHASWLSAIEKSQHILEYYFQVIMKRLPIHTLEGKKHARDALLPVIAAVSDAVEQSYFIERLAVLLHVETRSIKDALQKITSPSSLSHREPAEPVKTSRVFSVREAVLHLLAIALAYPKAIPRDIPFPPLVLKEAALSALYKDFSRAYNERALERYRQHLKKEQVDELSLLASKDYANLEPREVEREFRRLRTALYEKALSVRRAALIVDIKRAEAAGDRDRAEAFTAELDVFLKRSPFP